MSFQQPRIWILNTFKIVHSQFNSYFLVTRIKLQVPLTAKFLHSIFLSHYEFLIFNCFISLNVGDMEMRSWRIVLMPFDRWIFRTFAICSRFYLVSASIRFEIVRILISFTDWSLGLIIIFNRLCDFVNFGTSDTFLCHVNNNMMNDLIQTDEITSENIKFIKWITITIRILNFDLFYWNISTILIGNAIFIINEQYF